MKVPNKIFIRSTAFLQFNNKIKILHINFTDI